MKNSILLFLILVITKTTFSQTENPFQFIKIDNGQFVFEKIFTIDSLLSSKIDTSLQLFLPSQKGISNLKSQNQQIIANFNNLFIDYNKYDANNHSIICSSPINANVTIQIKDGKYKVLVNSIVFNTTGPILGSNQIVNKVMSAESIFLKNDQTDFRTRGDLIKIGQAIEHQFSEIFTIKFTNNDW